MLSSTPSPVLELERSKKVAYHNQERRQKGWKEARGQVLYEGAEERSRQRSRSGQAAYRPENHEKEVGGTLPRYGRSRRCWFMLVERARRALFRVPGYHGLKYQDADGVRTAMECQGRRPGNAAKLEVEPSGEVSWRCGK
jgi:hypothetical protein